MYRRSSKASKCAHSACIRGQLMRPGHVGVAHILPTSLRPPERRLVSGRVQHLLKSKSLQALLFSLVEQAKSWHDAECIVRAIGFRLIQKAQSSTCKPPLPSNAAVLVAHCGLLSQDMEGSFSCIIIECVRTGLHKNLQQATLIERCPRGRFTPPSVSGFDRSIPPLKKAGKPRMFGKHTWLGEETQNTSPKRGALDARSLLSASRKLRGARALVRRSLAKSRTKGCCRSERR